MMKSLTIILNPIKREIIEIGDYYKDGTLLKDLYSDETVVELKNSETIPKIENNIIILKKSQINNVGNKG